MALVRWEPFQEDVHVNLRWLNSSGHSQFASHRFGDIGIREVIRRGGELPGDRDWGR